MKLSDEQRRIFYEIKKWIRSPSGRMAAGYTVAILSSCLWGGYVMANSLFLYKLREFVEMNRFGEVVPLDEFTRKEAIEVLESMDLTEKKRGLVDFFTVSGFDVFHAGGTELRKGTIIGLPVNFSYTSLTQVDPLTMQGDDEFTWSSVAGTNFLDSLIYSPKAKRFAIAREISYADTYYVTANGFFMVGSTILPYIIGHATNEKFNLHKGPFSLRFINYLISCFIGLMLFFICYGATNVYYENASDKRAASLGQDYILGGIEFYEKLMERNKALRLAMGIYGENMYTDHGDVKYLIPWSHVSLVQRLENMKKRLVNIGYSE